MAPSDSKDDNPGATSFSWIVSTCINQANEVKRGLQQKKYKTHGQIWPLCQNRSILWSCRSSQAWGEGHRVRQDLMTLHRVIQHRRLGLECVEYVSALGGLFYLTFSRFFSVAFSNSQVNLMRSQCFEQPHRLISWDCHDHVHSSCVCAGILRKWEMFFIVLSWSSGCMICLCT